MSLVGRSFLWLVTLSLGSLVGVSLWVDSVRSYPVAALVGLLGLTMLRASHEISETTRSAIQHSLEADAANALLLLHGDKREDAGQRNRSAREAGPAHQSADDQDREGSPALNDGADGDLRAGARAGRRRG